MTLLQRMRPKSGWRPFLVQLAVVVLIIAAARMWVGRNAVSGEAPLFTSVLLDGTPVSLRDYRGEPLLLHFWATWCPICVWEHDTIEAIARDHAVLTVAMQSGDEAAVQAHLNEQGVAFPVVIDEDGTLADRFGVMGTPTTFVIDGTGEIRFVEVGYTTGWGLRLRLWLAGLW